jgi:hypothetical protein
MARFGAGSSSPAPRIDEDVPAVAMFFISYSRQTDGPRAEKLYETLVSLGASASEIWFDRNTVEPGNDFQRRIIDGIHGCHYFLPLISRDTDNRRKGFVFTEWEEATECFKGTNYEFLLPIIVDTEYDPESYHEKHAWKWSHEWKIDFGHAPEGNADGRLLAKLKEMIRNIRRGKEAA